VGWGRRHVAEIVGRFDETDAPMLLPHAVHHDARGEGILRIRNCHRELRTAGTVFPFGSFLRVGRKDFKETTRDHFTSVADFAPQ
jgi:hypothetical protein